MPQIIVMITAGFQGLIAYDWHYCVQLRLLHHFDKTFPSQTIDEYISSVAQKYWLSCNHPENPENHPPSWNHTSTGQKQQILIETRQQSDIFSVRHTLVQLI